jgi:hypothetical protein
MRKRDELADPTSCLNKAREDEWLFVLLGRDRAAIVAVSEWIKERIRLGKNTSDDPQIREAMAWIDAVECEQTFAETEPYTVEVGEFDDSRQAIYERTEEEKCPSPEPLPPTT